MKIKALTGWMAVMEVAIALFEKTKFTQREARAGSVTIKKVMDYDVTERKLLRAGFKWGFSGNAKDRPETRCLMKKWGRRQYAEAVQVWFNGPDDSVTIKPSFFEWDIWGITPPSWAGPVLRVNCLP
jgi:hypothetical protein